MQDAVSVIELDPKKALESRKYLTGSDHLESDERLQIYINDYWPRIVESLAEDFPKLKKLWGDDFIDWVQAYLTEMPADSHSLFNLGKRFPAFLKRRYKEKNRALVLEIANYEWAHAQLYFVKNSKALNLEKLNDPDYLMQSHFRLAPTAIPLYLQHDLINWNNQKQVQSIPTYAVVFRDAQFHILAQSVEFGLYTLLNLLKKPMKVPALIEAATPLLVSAGFNPEPLDYQKWFQTAVQNGWMTQTYQRRK